MKICAAVVGKVESFVDRNSGLGIGAGVGAVPEGAAQVDLSGLVGIGSRDLSATERQSDDWEIYAQV